MLPSIVAALVNLTASVAALTAGWGLTGLTSALLLSRIVDVTMRYLFWRRVWRSLRGDAQPAAAVPAAAVDVARMRRYAWRSSLLVLIDMIVWDRSEFFVLTRFSSLREVAFYSLSFNVVQQALTFPRCSPRDSAPTCWSSAAAIRKVSSGCRGTACATSSSSPRR